MRSPVSDRQPRLLLIALAALAGGLALCLLGCPARAAAAQAQKHPVRPSSRTQRPFSGKLTDQDTACIMNMLHAPSLAKAGTLKGRCRDSFTLRAAYASLLVKFHAPHADQAIIRNLPESFAEMLQLATFSGNVGSGHAYERYYHSIFRIVAARPELLPRFFAIAAQFGTNNPMVDEDTWLCEEQQRLYKRMPNAYMRAVRATKDPFYRRVALDCRSGPI